MMPMTWLRRATLLWFYAAAVALASASSIGPAPVVPPQLSDPIASRFEAHTVGVSLLQAQIQANPSGRITLKRSPGESHCARQHTYKEGQQDIQLDLSSFRSILAIDEEKLEVDVQAMCSFEELVDALLPLNLIPAVVPEFKGITVGGSLQGLAAESTSFRFGLVHDVITGFEALLGNGTVLWCSPTSNAELFHALPGSFGTLALCTRVRMQCIRAKPFVKVTCHRFASQSECLSHMCTPLLPADTDMIEGIGFGKEEWVAVEGRFVSSSGDSRLHRCNAWGHQWFYNQVRVSPPPHHHPANSLEFILPTKDYLFRHDRGSFWMASYRIPQVLGQFVFGSLLDSTNMFKLANLLPWAFPKSQIVLQDFMLPRENCEAFTSEATNEVASVWPLWLLPMRRPPRRRAEEDAVFGVPSQTMDLVNVGMYGIPKGSSYVFERDNRLLENLLHKHGGRKVLYSHSFYSKEFFYNSLYDGARYEQLRQKYSAAETLPDVWSKVVVKDGRL